MKRDIPYPEIRSITDTVSLIISDYFPVDSFSKKVRRKFTEDLNQFDNIVLYQNGPQMEKDIRHGGKSYTTLAKAIRSKLKKDFSFKNPGDSWPIIIEKTGMPSDLLTFIESFKFYLGGIPLRELPEYILDLKYPQRHNKDFKKDMSFATNFTIQTSPILYTLDLLLRSDNQLFYDAMYIPLRAFIKNAVAHYDLVPTINEFEGDETVGFMLTNLHASRVRYHMEHTEPFPSFEKFVGDNPLTKPFIEEILETIETNRNKTKLDFKAMEQSQDMFKNNFRPEHN